MPAGHRLRLAVGNAYWPWVWPSPEPVSMTVAVGGASALDLPVRQSPATEQPVPMHFSAPEAGPGLGVEIKHQPVGGRAATLDAGTGRHVIVDAPTFFASARLPDHGGIEFGDHERDEYELVEGDPLSAKMVCRRTLPIGRGDWQTRVEAVTTMTSTATHFLVTTVLEAFEHDRRVFARTWSHSIRRQLA
jgi:hypothetical protein